MSTTPISKDIIDFIKKEIKAIDEELFQLQHSIWEKPELKYEEYHAHQVLTDYIEKQEGWTVEKHAFNLETAFVATFAIDAEKNPAVISFNSEYDALPGIGHACGHNLIAVCGLTGAIATALAMKKFNISGTIKYFGTPAEEAGGGKIKMLEAGAWKNVDVSLMAHPGNTKPRTVTRTTANQRFKLEFFGKEAHAAAAPWEGINALDAMNLTYNAVSVLRQQTLPSDIIQCNISDGGLACNIITAYTSATFGVRSKTRSRLDVLVDKVIKCCQGAALATGCKLKIEFNTNYYNMIVNEWLARSFITQINNAFDEYNLSSYEEDSLTGDIGASSDEGNVSFEVPSLQSGFEVKAGCSPHNPAFTAAAGTRESHKSAVDCGIGLSLVGLELLSDRSLMEKVKASFKQDLEDSKPKGVDVIEKIETIKQLEYNK